MGRSHAEEASVHPAARREVSVSSFLPHGFIRGHKTHVPVNTTQGASGELLPHQGHCKAAGRMNGL